MLCHQLVAHSISGVPKVQWIKRWFIDLVVPGNLPGRKRCYISNSHLLAPSDRPNMTEILFKNITLQVIHPFTVHFSGTLDCSVSLYETRQLAQSEVASTVQRASVS